jgi:hypothetical protein
MAVNLTTIWRARPLGNNANGGGYDPGIAGAGTDYSQQDAAQASGTNGSATGTTTFTASGFTSAMVGNAINIAGQGFYFVTAFTDASNVVVDRALGTFSGASWQLGGAWADFWTNTTSIGPLVPGNTIYLLGSGIPNYSSYVYDYQPPAYFSSVAGDNTNGLVTYATDPATPGYDGTTSGSMACILCNALGGAPGLLFYGTSYLKISLLWLVSGGNWGTTIQCDFTIVYRCVYDQNGWDTCIGHINGSVTSCEVFSSVTQRVGNSNGGIAAGNNPGSMIENCNIHDCIGPGVVVSSGMALINCIIAKNGGDGVYTAGNYWGNLIANNTIDGNAGHGINITDRETLSITTIMGNLITNHTGVGKAGLAVTAPSTLVQIDRIKAMMDYNSFYNNTTTYLSVSPNPHDVVLSSDPYVGQSTQNYKLK